jgi:hypothetical protein
MPDFSEVDEGYAFSYLLFLIFASLIEPTKISGYVLFELGYCAIMLNGDF